MKMGEKERERGRVREGAAEIDAASSVKQRFALAL